MRDFLMRHREGLLLVILVLSSLLIISWQVQDPTGISYFRSSVISVAWPFQNGVSAVIGGVRSIWGDYLFFFGT